jgi:hypothetical protein
LTHFPITPIWWVITRSPYLSHLRCQRTAARTHTGDRTEDTLLDSHPRQCASLCFLNTMALCFLNTMGHGATYMWAGRTYAASSLTSVRLLLELAIQREALACMDGVAATPPTIAPITTKPGRGTDMPSAVAAAKVRAPAIHSTHHRQPVRGHSAHSDREHEHPGQPASQPAALAASEHGSTPTACTIKRASERS